MRLCCERPFVQQTRHLYAKFCKKKNNLKCLHGPDFNTNQSERVFKVPSQLPFGLAHELPALPTPLPPMDQKAVWESLYKDATTVAEVEAAHKSVTDAQLTFVDDDDSSAVPASGPIIRVPLDSPAIVKAVFVTNVMKQVKGVINGVIDTTPAETAAVLDFLGPLPPTSKFPAAAVLAAGDEDGKRRTCIVAFSSGPTVDACTFALLCCTDGVVDQASAVIVCGRDATTTKPEQYDSAASGSPFLKLRVPHAGTAVRQLAAWFLLTVNASIAPNLALTMPNEAREDAGDDGSDAALPLVILTMKKRIADYNFFGMRPCSAARWKAAALKRITGEAPPPKVRAKPVTSKAQSKRDAKGKNKTDANSAKKKRSSSASAAVTVAVEAAKKFKSKSKSKPKSNTKHHKSKRSDSSDDEDGSGNDSGDDSDVPANASALTDDDDADEDNVRDDEDADADEDDNTDDDDSDGNPVRYKSSESGTVFDPSTRPAGRVFGYTSKEIDSIVADVKVKTMRLLLRGKKVRVVAGNDHDGNSRTVKKYKPSSTRD